MTQFIKNVAKQTGGVLDELEECVKTPKSAERKVYSYMSEGALDVDVAFSQIKDFLRYTIVYDTENYTAGVEAAIKLINDDKNYELIRITNRFGEDNNVYKDILTRIKEMMHSEFVELQFHTPETSKAKRVAHFLYEITRGETFKHLDKELRDSLTNAMIELYKQFVTIPQNVDRIKDK